MTVSVRSYLTAGVAALAASAVVIAPVHTPLRSAITAETVRLSAAVQPLLQPTNAAAAVLGLVDAPAPAKPAAASSTATPQAAATGDWVVSAWQWADYWIGYGAQLVDYALGWVWPLSLIGDQAPLLWYNLGSPIGDATVYGLIVPVLNDPLNLSVWGAGLAYVAQASVTALINTGVAEFNYFVGWFLPPLPPLPFPPLPFAATPTLPAALAATPTGTSATASASETAVAPSDSAPSGTGHTRRPGVVAKVESAVAAAADAVDNAAKTVTAPLKSATTDQGTGAGSHSDTPKAASTVSDSPDAGTNAPDAGSSTAKSAQDNGKKAHSTGGSAREHKARGGN